MVGNRISGSYSLICTLCLVSTVEYSAVLPGDQAIDLAIRERSQGPVSLTADRRLGRHGAAPIVRRVTCRAGISKHVSPHTLRHAFITAAQFDAGVPFTMYGKPPRTETRAPR